MILLLLKTIIINFFFFILVFSVLYGLYWCAFASIHYVSICMCTFLTTSIIIMINYNIIIDTVNIGKYCMTTIIVLHKH